MSADRRELRLMEAADITRLAEIVSLNYCIDYARQFRIEAAEALRGGVFAPTIWVAAADQPVGCVAWTSSALDWNVACLTWVNVAPSSQRQGVVRKLVGRALRDVASSFSTAILTTRTPKWYEPWGFKNVSLLKGEKDDPYHLMICDLDASPNKDHR